MAEGPTRPPPGSTPARGRGQPRDVARRLGTLPRARGGLGTRGPATSRGPSGPSVGGLWHAAGLPAPLRCQPAVGREPERFRWAHGPRVALRRDRALRSLPTGSRPPRSCARGARGAPQAGAVGSAIALLHALLSLPLMRPEFAPLTREQEHRDPLEADNPAGSASDRQEFPEWARRDFPEPAAPAATSLEGRRTHLLQDETLDITDGSHGIALTMVGKWPIWNHVGTTP
jgi:hypothetical protein